MRNFIPFILETKPSKTNLYLYILKMKNYAKTKSHKMKLKYDIYKVYAMKRNYISNLFAWVVMKLKNCVIYYYYYYYLWINHCLN